MAGSITRKGRHRLARGLTAVVLVAGAGAGVAMVGAAPSYAATSYTATPRNVCLPGSTKLTWSRISKPWAVDHATEVVNDTPGSVTQTSTMSSKEVVRASAQIDAGASIKENTLIESLQAYVHLKLAVAGSHTTSKSESLKVTLTPQSTDIVFHAVHLVAGTFTHWRCGVNGYKSIGSGTAHSWYIDADGAVNCPGSKGYKRPAAGTAGRAAQVFC